MADENPYALRPVNGPVAIGKYIGTGIPSVQKVVLDYFLQQTFGKVVDVTSQGAKWAYDTAGNWLKEKLGSLNKGERSKFPGDPESPSTTVIPPWDQMSSEQKKLFADKFGADAQKVATEYGKVARNPDGTPILVGIVKDELLALLFMLSTLKRVAYNSTGGAVEKTLTIDEAGVLLRRLAALGPMAAGGNIDAAIEHAKSMGNVPAWIKNESESGLSDAFAASFGNGVLRNRGG